MTATQYEADHWSRREATDESLERYLSSANDIPYNAAKRDLLDRIVGDVRGANLLDYGGGAGYFGLRYGQLGARVTLVDPAQPALDLAHRLAARWDIADRLTTVRSDTVPHFIGERFDVILLKDVIEHIPDDAGLLAQLAALQPMGGRLVLTTHNQWSLNYLIEGTYKRWWCGERDWLGWDPTHVRFYSPRTIGRLLLAAGYRPLKWASVFIVPYNIMTWLLLLRRQVELPQLAWIDRAVGTVFPFSRLGWNILVTAEKVAAPKGA